MLDRITEICELVAIVFDFAFVLDLIRLRREY